MSHSFGSRSDLTFLGSDLGLICDQHMTLADKKLNQLSLIIIKLDTFMKLEVHCIVS